MYLAGLAQRAFAAAGLDVHLWSARRRRQLDAYVAQQWLLRDRPVRTIFDVGANTGQTATHYHSLFPQANIYSFEPFEQSYSSLAANFRDVPQVRPQQLAVADSSGTRSFFVQEQSVNNSLLQGSDASKELLGAEALRQAREVKVTTTTLDTFCASEKIPAIDILKMDIQGGELLALKGAQELLSRKAISLVYTEVLFASLYDGQAFAADLMQEMTRYGYALYGLYDLQYPQAKRLAWGDAIFIDPALDR